MAQPLMSGANMGTLHENAPHNAAAQGTHNHPNPNPGTHHPLQDTSPNVPHAHQATAALRRSKKIYNPHHRSTDEDTDTEADADADADGIALGVLPDHEGQRWRERRMRLARYIQFVDGPVIDDNDVPAPLEKWLDLALEREAVVAPVVKGGKARVCMGWFVEERPGPRGEELRKRRVWAGDYWYDAREQATEEAVGAQIEFEDRASRGPGRGRFGRRDSWDDGGLRHGDWADWTYVDSENRTEYLAPPVTPGPAQHIANPPTASSTHQAPPEQPQPQPLSEKALGKRPAVDNQNRGRKDPFGSPRRSARLSGRRRVGERLPNTNLPPIRSTPRFSFRGFEVGGPSGTRGMRTR
ncbi:hypothetical protein VP1G_00314 [Cytospora mali]|uniref:Uncharacterized protein n=1 Tax=Cytospora mali TaxID=578113 RepID=A0A194UN52_CYTMA|nr:hypothetical protein VP1G_00314 [Valsa mali var. pyri (nom. inval.)]